MALTQDEMKKRNQDFEKKKDEVRGYLKINLEEKKYYQISDITELVYKTFDVYPPAPEAFRMTHHIIDDLKDEGFIKETKSAGEIFYSIVKNGTFKKSA